VIGAVSARIGTSPTYNDLQRAVPRIDPAFPEPVVHDREVVEISVEGRGRRAIQLIPAWDLDPCSRNSGWLIASRESVDPGDGDIFPLSDTDSVDDRVRDALPGSEGRMNSAEQDRNRGPQILDLLAKASDERELRSDATGCGHVTAKIVDDFLRDALQWSIRTNDPAANFVASTFQARSYHAETEGNFVPAMKRMFDRVVILD